MRCSRTRDGDIRSDNSQHPLVFDCEGIQVCAFQIEHADEPVLKQQRNHQLRSNAIAMRKFNVTLVQANVIDARGQPVTRGVSRDPFEEGDGELHRNGFFVCFAKAHSNCALFSFHTITIKRW
jgi:hypothetical protein